MAVYSFGWGKFGQLGQATEASDHVDPVIVSSLKGKRVVTVCCGESHSMAITEYGDLYTWGRGREGQLGNGDRENSSVPRQVEKLAHERIVKACCGQQHSVALTDTGKVYNWGKIHKLLDDMEMAARPTRYYGIGVEDIGERTQDMLKRSHMEYLGGTSDDGTVLNYDQIDPSQYGDEFGRFANFTQTTPIIVDALRGKQIVEVAAGYSCTAAVTDCGQLYTWGFNEKGQLGLGHRFNSDVPRLVHAFNGIRVVGVALGNHHTIVLDEHGNVFSCGLGVFGQLGHGNLDDLRVPKRIEFFAANKIVVVQVVCGAHYTVCRSSSGHLYSFGHGEYGQHGGLANYADWGSGRAESAGKATHLQNSTPEMVKGFEDTKVNHVACGHLHTVAVTESNQIFTWGWGASGRLGHGDARFQLVPRLVTSLQGEEMQYAAAGAKHTLVIKAGSLSTFAFDFRPAINTPKYSDITFVVQNKPVHAHKVIVCARCPYLYAAFLMHARFVGNGIEPNQFPIKKVRLPIFMALLTYLYTDHLICPVHICKELGLVASRFGLPRLASLCKRADYRAWAHFGEPAPVIVPSSFSDDMLAMVNNRSYADLEFKMDTGDRVKAHRVILAARSQYFHRMFEGSFKERDQSVFNCEEGQALTSFVAFLGYLYTGNSGIAQVDNAVELLALSDRMIVEDLKQLCESFLERLVSSAYLALISNAQIDTDNDDVTDACENTVALLEIGDKYEAKRLKRVCLEAVCGSGEKNWQMLSEKQAFKELRMSSPTLFRELDYLASKNGLISDNQMFFRTTAR